MRILPRFALIGLLLAGLLNVLSPATVVAEQSAQTELVWYGHSAFKITTPNGYVLYVDPWLTNPLNPDGEADVKNVQKADLILVSHGHFDHVGNAVDIAKQTGARLVTTFDLGNALVAYAGYPKDKAGYDSLGNFGGQLSFFDDEIKITLIPAVHSSTVAHGDNQPEYGGNPGGFLIQIANGPTIYHTGDTDLFSDMALIPEHHPVDLMLTCIGDHFTMGPKRAAKAVSLVSPKTVIPMHYGTFPDVLPGSVSDFKVALQAQKATSRLRVLPLEQPALF